jgi:hypothetical protein
MPLQRQGSWPRQLPARRSQLAPDQTFDRGKRHLLVEFDLEQLEFEIMDPVLRLKRSAEITAPLE